jgi:hypothetical protein
MRLYNYIYSMGGMKPALCAAESKCTQQQQQHRLPTQLYDEKLSGS